ncbi:hypothetical protein MKX01_007422, partial [Papaver californicum]
LVISTNEFSSKNSLIGPYCDWFWAKNLLFKFGFDLRSISLAHLETSQAHLSGILRIIGPKLFDEAGVRGFLKSFQVCWVHNWLLIMQHGFGSVHE